MRISELVNCVWNFFRLARIFLTMDMLGPEERRFREEKMLVTGENVVAAYYGREEGKMALKLRRDGAVIMEWDKMERAREMLDIPRLGSEVERKEREDNLMEGG
jgi:hypothetical protein